jgi:hypothetical protein
MPHRLEGCHAKLTRAEELIGALEGESAGPRASILAGDVLYNLRSCLDHLVHQLIVAHTDVEPSYRTYEFPIFRSEKQFDESRNRMLRDVSPEATSRIREVQPFRSEAPAESPLYLLQQLHDLDRRRLLLADCPAPPTLRSILHAVRQVVDDVGGSIPA